MCEVSSAMLGDLAANKHLAARVQTCMELRISGVAYDGSTIPAAPAWIIRYTHRLKIEACQILAQSSQLPSTFFAVIVSNYPLRYVGSAVVW